MHSLSHVVRGLVYNSFFYKKLSEKQPGCDGLCTPATTVQGQDASGEDEAKALQAAVEPPSPAPASAKVRPGSCHCNCA